MQSSTTTATHCSLPGRHPAARVPAVLVLWVALLLAQMLALMHPIVHGGGAGHVDEPAAHAAATAGGLDHHAGDWLQALFPGHEDAASCELVDGLGLQPIPLVLPCVLPQVQVAAPLLRAAQGEVLRRWALLFDARGPPPAR